VAIPTRQNPDTPEGLKQRLSIRIYRIPAELPHLSKLELRNPIGPRSIPAEHPRSSYEEGSRQAGRPFGLQSLTTLPTRLRLATTLRMGALQVQSPKCGVCVCRISLVGGIYRAMGELHRLGRGGNLPRAAGRPSHMIGWPLSLASTDFVHRHSLSLLV
jgi:hypothetical protein